jgi:hypothetical protein
VDHATAGAAARRARQLCTLIAIYLCGLRGGSWVREGSGARGLVVGGGLWSGMPRETSPPALARAALLGVWGTVAGMILLDAAAQGRLWACGCWEVVGRAVLRLAEVAAVFGVDGF